MMGKLGGGQGQCFSSVLFARHSTETLRKLGQKTGKMGRGQGENKQIQRELRGVWI